MTLSDDPAMYLHSILRILNEIVLAGVLPRDTKIIMKVILAFATLYVVMDIKQKSLNCYCTFLPATSSRS
jgi:hypothetical protein